MAQTLGELLARRDEEGWVGRGRELSELDALLDPEAAARLVFVHGPGGMGKSSLLRRLARTAQEAGWDPRLVDARDLDPVPGALERALGDLDGAAPPLILLDTYERMTGLDGHLRRHVIPALPAASRVVVAGRRPPAAEWLQGGWEQVVRELRLEGLSRDEALTLVRGRGISDPEAASELLTWAAGSPLLLTLGADAARADGGWSPRRLEGDRALADVLLRRLTQSELERRYVPVIELAGLARTVTAPLVAALVADLDAEQALEWLRERSFAEPAGGAGVRLHEAVRTAVRAHGRATDPDRDRDLRRRLADHFFARGAAGETSLLIDLAELLETPALRWGMGAEGTVDFRVDTIRESDFDTAREAARTRDAGPWWEATDALLREAPGLAVVVRDPEERVCGLAIAATPHAAPAAADRDPVLGPWLDHARRNVPDGDVVVWRDSLDFTATERGDVSSRVLAIVNTATILRSGLTNPRWSYLPINPENAVAVAFAKGVGARHEPSLDVQVGRRLQQCHVLYHGIAGVLGGTRDMVYRELGLEPPSPGSPVRAGAATAEDVRHALRHLHQPVELAGSPLAGGSGTAERAASVRVLLEDALVRAFGDSPAERLLHDIARRAYFEPQGSHETAAHELHVSRATYFRRLRQATERMADYLGN